MKMTSPSRSTVPLALLILLLGVFGWPANAQVVAGTKPPPEHPDPVLRTQAQLNAYLRQHAENHEPTPLDALSAGARARFLSSLAWGSHSLGGFDHADLAEELDDNQIRAVLALFGSDMLVYAPASRAAALGVHRSAGDRDRISDLERRYNLYERQLEDAHRTQDDLVRQHTTASRFAEFFPEANRPEHLHDLADHDLRLLWRAAAWAAIAAPSAADAASSIFEEGERRNIVDRIDARQMRNILLTGRRLEQARRFTVAHPDAGLSTLPVFDDPQAGAAQPATVWRMSADGNRLTRATIDLEPTQILVTAGCHFSVDAAQDIPADPILGPVFARHAHWLVNTPGVEDIEAVREWNRRFPTAQPEMIHDRAGWSILPTWSMPKFHMVRDGKVIETVEGWPRSPTSNRQPLIDALRRAGLLEQFHAVPASP
jgi:hypothetical protein